MVFKIQIFDVFEKKMTDKPTTAQELEELFGKVDWDKVFKDELTSEVKRQLDYNMSIILNGTFGVDEKDT